MRGCSSVLRPSTRSASFSGCSRRTASDHRLALGLLSTLSADRLVRAIREKDIATLQGVPRVGKKKAERLVLDLSDKLDDVAGSPVVSGVRAEGAHAEDAIRALVSLGYATVDAEKAVRSVLDTGPVKLSAPELIRAALAKDRRPLSGIFASGRVRLR